MARRAVVDYRESVNGEWEWVLVAANGEDVAGSGHQGFRDMTDAERGFMEAQRIMRLAGTGHYVREVPQPPPPVEEALS